MLRVALICLLFGCSAAAPPEPPPDETGPTDEPPPEEPVPPAPAKYVRGSLSPIFQLTPRIEYGRFTEGGVTMRDADFTSPQTTFVTASQKLDELGAQIGKERALPPLDLMPRAEDRQRAQLIPFRGNPSDVDIVVVTGRRKAYVPLGGDLMTPGNEVASIDLDTKTVTRIKVGIRPQRIAVHPAGLVFVCNQYSNYISVIDPRTDQLMQGAQGVLEIKTEFYCTDLAFAATLRATSTSKTSTSRTVGVAPCSSTDSRSRAMVCRTRRLTFVSPILRARTRRVSRLRRSPASARIRTGCR